MSEEIIIKKSLSQQIYSVLKKQIISGKLELGERLNIELIAKKYNVSRTPIREAINRLRQEGFIEHIHNVGPSVVKFKPEDVVELVYVNRVLFTGIIELIFKNSDIDILLKQLKECVNQQELAHEQDDLEKFLYYSVEFHRILIKNCGNKRMEQITLMTQAQLDMSVLNYVKSKHNKLKSIKDHKEIYNAIVESDIEKTIELMKKHNVDAENHYISLYD
ncbi:GntR family transcriptional regulator [Clostridiaceae bacterium M8S5]|nr:GntR family transcriptional regulator [Clostridiaceae bacterium M8S5]